MGANIFEPSGCQWDADSVGAATVTGLMAGGVVAMATGAVAALWAPGIVGCLASPPCRGCALLRPGAPSRGAVAWAVAVGVAAGVLVVRLGARPGHAAVVVATLGALGVSAAVDWHSLRLPDAISAPVWLVGWVAMVVVSLTASEPGALRGLVAGGAAAGVALGAGWLVGMGLGDVKVGATLGGVVGWLAGDALRGAGTGLWLVVAACTLAVIASGTGALVRPVRARWRPDMGKEAAPHGHAQAALGVPFPFGPYLVAGGAVVAALVGTPGA